MPFWASLVAQLVKNLPAVQEPSVGEIPWRRERLPTPVLWSEEFVVCMVHRSESRTQLSDFHYALSKFMYRNPSP